MAPLSKKSWHDDLPFPKHWAGLFRPENYRDGTGNFPCAAVQRAYLGPLQRLEKIDQGRDAALHCTFISFGAAKVLLGFHLEPGAPHRHFAVSMIFYGFAPVDDCSQPFPWKHPT